MNRITFIYLILFTFLVHYSNGDEEESDDNSLKAGQESDGDKEDEGGEDGDAKLKASGGDDEGEGDGEEESGGGKGSGHQRRSGGGGGGGDTGTSCKCCAGHGIKCGTRLKFCGGGDDCHKNKLYYCDPKSKKTYIYEECRMRCLMDTDEDYPDYCSIRMDQSFLFVREDNIEKWKRNFNKSFEEYKKKFKDLEKQWSIEAILPPEDNEDNDESHKEDDDNEDNGGEKHQKEGHHEKEEQKEDESNENEE